MSPRQVVVIICFIVLQLTLLSSAVHAQDQTQPAAATALEIGPDTTVYKGPLREDGTVDYAAALNHELSEGVTNENNAYVALLDIMPVMQWDKEYRENLYTKLNLPRPKGDEPTRFTPFDKYFANLEPDQSKRKDLHQRALEKPWTKNELPHVAEWLAINDKALHALKNAVQRKRYWAPLITDGQLVDVLLPHLGDQGDLARALAIRANLRLDRGQLEAAWDDVPTLKRLARLPGHEPVIISGLVGASINALSINVACEIFREDRLTPTQARQFAADIKTLPAMPSPRRWIGGERFMVLDLLQQLFVHPGQSREGMIFQSLALQPISKDTRKRLWTYLAEGLAVNHALRRWNAVNDKMLKVMRTPSFPRMLDQLKKVEQQIDARLMKVRNGDGLVQELGSLPPSKRQQRVVEYLTDVLASLEVPAQISAIKATARSQTLEDLERVALALATYRTEHGNYPASLEALTPNYLDQLPQDPFAEAPLRYKREKDAIVIYSIGYDFEDNGGNADAGDGDIAIRLSR